MSGNICAATNSRSQYSKATTTSSTRLATPGHSLPTTKTASDPSQCDHGRRSFLRAVGIRRLLPQRFPHALSSCHDARADDEIGAHENQRACAAHDFALGFDKLADLNRVDEMHIELDRGLRLALICIPAGH